MEEGKGFYVKLHNHGSTRILAVCDEEILGKEFREGSMVLRVNKEFYYGKLVNDVDEVLRLITNADVVIATGSRIVKELAKRGLADESFALKVGDQLHLQILRERL